MEMIDKLRELSKKLEDPYFIKEFEEGFEKFLKEKDMEVYHVKTQADYDALMIKIEEKGRKWICGNEPTFFKFWKTYKESTCIIISDKGVTFGDIEYYKKQYPNTPIIEYKAKGEKMEKNKNVKYLMFDTTDDVGLFSVKVISENLDEFKTHVLKYILDRESDMGYIEIGLLNPDNSVERLEL